MKQQSSQVNKKKFAPTACC